MNPFGPAMDRVIGRLESCPGFDDMDCGAEMIGSTMRVVLVRLGVCCGAEFSYPEWTARNFDPVPTLLIAARKVRAHIARKSSNSPAPDIPRG